MAIFCYTHLPDQRQLTLLTNRPVGFGALRVNSRTVQGSLPTFTWKSASRHAFIPPSSATAPWKPI